MTPHAVFLSYNSVDHLAVEEIARRLRAADIELWLDAWQVAAGDPVQRALEQALTETRASVVFIGPSGIGPWQEEEMRVAIERRVRESAYRVIPVLLPGALRGKRSAVPPFLASVRWVEFQRSLDEAPPFRALIAGIHGRPPVTATSATVGANPYRGLQAFDVGDSGLFFGREALTDWLRSDLRSSLASRGASRLLAIVGASGSGKSSLARAGLLAQLVAGALDGSAHWPQIVLKPGADPLASLSIAGADALAMGADDAAVLTFQDRLLADARSLHTRASLALRGTPIGTRLVLLVDQFEEVFTLCSSEPLRHAFIDNLLHAAGVTDGPTLVVLTLRADFLGKCAAYPPLAAVLSGSQELVGPMSRDELREAIERPAWQAGCEFQPGLVDVLLDDVEAQPGGLPLLQHALFELWREQADRRLTHAAYEGMGGVRGALAGRADEVYRRFTPAEQALTRRLLLRLTQPGEGTEDTRRRASFAEILPADEARPTVEGIVRTLTDARLLVTEGETVDVAHEALIQGWPTLREWLDQDREGLREHRRLTVAAEEWQRLEHDESVLYRGLRLDRALAWREKNEEALNALEREFLDAGSDLHAAEEARRLAREQEREEQRQRELEQARRLAEEAEARRVAEAERAAEAALRATQQRKLTRIASLVSTVAVILGLAAGGLWWMSETQRGIAEAGRLTSESQHELDGRFDLGLLLASAAVQASPTAEALSSLLAGIQSHPRLGTFLREHKEQVNTVAFSPDGKTLASADRGGTVILWDVAGRKPLGEPLAGPKLGVRSVAFSPDGKTLASAGGDGTVILWDVATLKPIAKPLGDGWEGRVMNITFSPDDKAWGEPRAGHKGSVESVAFSPEGKTLASAGSDGTVILWDVAKRKPVGEPLASHKGSVESVAFSPEGKTLASAGGDGTVILWDVATRKSVGEPLAGHKGSVESVAFSPEGKTLASAGEDGTVILWDVATRKPVGEPLAGHKGRVTSVAFRPDGKTLASAGWDGTVILWNVAERRPRGEALAGHNEWVTSVAFSPDGKTMASADGVGTVILWDVAERIPLGEPLAGHTGGVLSVAFSPDGKTLASAGWDETMILWDVAARKPMGEPLVGHKDTVSSVAFSPDGKTLASGSWDKTVILWDVAAGRPMGEPLAAHKLRVDPSVAFKERKSLAEVAARGPLREPPTGHEDGVTSVAFSPNGKTLASASQDETMILWDIASRKPVGNPIFHHDIHISVAFSPDGRTLASSASEDTTVILWDVAEREPVHMHSRFDRKERYSVHVQEIPRHLPPFSRRGKLLDENAASSVAFSPEGKTLASARGDGTVILWDVATRKPVGEPLAGHKAKVTSVAFSPGGKTLASASEDKTVILWDVATRKPVGEPLAGHKARVTSVAFSPDGKTLASASVDKTVILWDVARESWQNRACGIANRNLSCEEWRDFMGERPYRKVCDKLPAPEPKCS